MFLLVEVVMDAEVESVMASSQDQREEELQVIITYYGPIKINWTKQEDMIPQSHTSTFEGFLALFLLTLLKE